MEWGTLAGWDPWAALPPDLAVLAGAATAVGAGLALGLLAARLRVAARLRPAVVAGYAVAVLALELGAGPPVDGTGLLLLTGAAALASSGHALRTAAALVLLAGAVAVMPVAAAGGLALAAGMAVTGDLGKRLGRPGRALFAVAGAGGAVMVTVLLARPGEQAALPPAVAAVLTVVAAAVAVSAWRRLVWARPAAAAVIGVLGCVWVPGPDGDATLITGAAVALLGAVLVEAAGPAASLRAAGATVAAAAFAVTVVLVPLSPSVSLSPSAVLEPAPAAPAGAGAEGEPAIRPVHLAIPAIGVAGPLEDLVADPVTRELAAPADPALAGWYAAGVVPGQRGPAVVGGHVDSRRGPGVFFRLRTLHAGDVVEITRSDASIVRFRVIAVRSYPKDAFPSDAVYGPTSGPELRLVTCGGRFDRVARSYDDNIVVDTILI